MPKEEKVKKEEKEPKEAKARFVNLDETGRIPAYQECPYQAECKVKAEGHCHHKGKEHAFKFSCALARAFDLEVRNSAG